VRAAGLDVGVHRSDRRSRVGKLTKQGSPHARWALYEAAQSAARPGSPDHGAYLALKARGLSHTRTSLTIARKLARRCFHSLRSSATPRWSRSSTERCRPSRSQPRSLPAQRWPIPSRLLPQ
jgi:transposase